MKERCYEALQVARKQSPVICCRNGKGYERPFKPYENVVWMTVEIATEIVFNKIIISHFDEKQLIIRTCVCKCGLTIFHGNEAILCYFFRVMVKKTLQKSRIFS